MPTSHHKPIIERIKDIILDDPIVSVHVISKTNFRMGRPCTYTDDLLDCELWLVHLSILGDIIVDLYIDIDTVDNSFLYGK
tara:strand:- start:6968 stop:7210 length:243 start_codon:yes stop_codon:yes gene_type:complete